MEMDEYARMQSTRFGLQALLTVMMRYPATAAIAVEAKNIALQFATETDRKVADFPGVAEQSEMVYAEVEDLFRPVMALQKRAGPNGS